MNNLFSGSREPIRFALYTTAAALLGLGVAALAGLHHPWWASMTVWLVAQPTRGLLLERVVARLSGTLIGAAAGEAMLQGLGGAPLPTLAVLTAWVGLCAAGGSLFRHFRTYTFVLSGYSAAIVVLFALAAPGGVQADVALDRVLCTVIGILCSSIVALGTAPRREGAGLAGRLDALAGCVLDHVDGRPAEPGARDDLLAAIATLNRDADDIAAGSSRERRAARRVRRVAPLLVALLASQSLASKSLAPDPATPATDGALGDRIDRLCARAGDRAELCGMLGELRAALGAQPSRLAPRLRWSSVSPGRMVRAALRPMVAIVAASALWQATHWPYGAMMTVAAALFASLFSSNAQGNRALLHALAGCIAGALLGVFFRLEVLPADGGLLLTVVGLLPVLLAGAALMRNRATAKLAIDLNMTFLLTAQPLTPPGAAATTIAIGGSTIAGVLIAGATFWLVLPASAATSRRLLRRRAIRLAKRIRHASNGAERGQLRQVLAANVLRQLELDSRRQTGSFTLLAAVCNRSGGAGRQRD
jgi:uncharacterized membrane protein YccC